MCHASAALAPPQTQTALPGRDFGRALRRVVLQIINTLHVWQERARQRRELAQLDDRMLRDIGLTRSDVYRETSKPFWAP